MAQDLEGKLKDGDRKALLKDWVYLAAAQNPNEKISINSGGKPQEIGMTYSQVALSKLIENAQSEKEAGYIGAILQAYSADTQKDGTITPKSGTQAALNSLIHGYMAALSQSPVSEVAGLARELGYKDKFPEFLTNYNGTYEQLAEEAKNKAESKDEKTKVQAEALAGAISQLGQVILMEARDRMRDWVLGNSFINLNEMYKNPDEVLKEREEKKKKGAK